MYQFTFRHSRLHPFLPYFITFFFKTTAISHLIIIHKTPLSALSIIRGNKPPIPKMYFSSLIQRSFLCSEVHHRFEHSPSVVGLLQCHSSGSVIQLSYTALEMTNQPQYPLIILNRAADSCEIVSYSNKNAF